MSVDPAIPTVAIARSEEDGVGIARWRSAGHALFVIAACVTAFHYSLVSLATSLTQDTPLANLALIPVEALLLAAATARPRPQEPTIHDRELDWIVGIPLLLAAGAMSVLVRDHWSGLYWTWRLDLLTLPVFVAGVVAMVFGTRMLWRIRMAVLLLFAAWPVPAELLVTSAADHLTHATTRAVSAVLRLVPVASPAGEAWLLSVGAGAGRFEVAVTQACSGAYGLVGFAVVGGAIIACTHGSWLRKLGWLTVGLVLTWLANVARILILLAFGERWGEQAIVEFHPHVGFATFAVAVLAMVGLSSGAGLRWPTPDPDRRSALLPRSMGRPTIVVVALAALAFAVLNTDLKRFAPLSEPLGAPLTISFEGAGAPVAPVGWVVTAADRTAELTTTGGVFGDDSTWFRYRYVNASAPAETPAILVDVVTTAEPRTLDTNGVAESYGFRRDEALREEAIDLVGGISATAMAFQDEERTERVTTLHWVWPVKTVAGRLYERIALTGSTPAHDDRSRARLVRDVEELSRLARDLITAQAHMSTAAQLLEEDIR